MLEISLQQLLSRLVAMLAVTAIHGFMLALAARVFGDKGPQQDGRLTLNPFQHLDLLAIVASVLFQVGWIKPMAIDVDQLLGKWVGAVAMVIVALAGTLLVALLLSRLQGVALSYIPQATLSAILANLLATILDLAIWFALINLIPIPPLAAGIVLGALLPGFVARLQTYDIVVRVVFIAILATGVVQGLLRPAHDLLQQWLSP